MPVRLTVRLALRPAVPEKLKRASCPGTVTFTVCAGPPEVSVADGSAPTSYTVAVTEPALGLTVDDYGVRAGERQHGRVDERRRARDRPGEVGAVRPADREA